MATPTPASNTIQAAIARGERFYRLREVFALANPITNVSYTLNDAAYSTCVIGPNSDLGRYFIGYTDQAAAGSPTGRLVEITPQSPLFFPLPVIVRGGMSITAADKGQFLNTSIGGSYLSDFDLSGNVVVNSIQIDVFFYFGVPLPQVALVRPSSVLTNKVTAIIGDEQSSLAYQWAFGRKRLHALISFDASTDPLTYQIVGRKMGGTPTDPFVQEAVIANGSIPATGGTAVIDVNTLAYDAVTILGTCPAGHSVGPIYVTSTLMDDGY